MEEGLSASQQKLLIDIAKDFNRYRINNLYIKAKDAQVVPFDPNIAQRALIYRVLELLDQGKPIRIIILKARQMGLSTAVEALVYWWTSTNQNITSMIVGHEEASSKNLYNMFKRYYQNSNPLFKPATKWDTKTDLTFAKELKDGTQIGLNSVIKTATAGNVSAGRSDTIQILHGSEIGEWEHGEELVASLLQTVPFLPKTMIFLESTANGVGNFFHKQWKSSVAGDNVFEPFFFPWWIQDEYEIDSELTEEDYTEEEKYIVNLMREGMMVCGELYTVPEAQIPRKIQFRRLKEREFKATPERLYQEYPSYAEEAFLGTGRPVFDRQSLIAMMRTAERSEPKYYEMHQDLARNITVTLSQDKTPLRIIEEVNPYDEYVIGADVAEGIRGGDYSVADVIRKKDMKTVARWRGHCDPDQFGHILDKLGRYYNFALLGVEINNHGLAVVQRLRDLFYTNLYRREKGMDERFEESTSKLGWKTTILTKPLAIDYLAEAIREGLVKDEDVVFVEEAMSYVRDDNGRTNAEVGTHDDTVMAKAIALQMFEWSDNNKGNLKVHVPKQMRARKNRRKVVK